LKNYLVFYGKTKEIILIFQLFFRQRIGVKKAEKFFGILIFQSRNN
jgi:hypothetical protein